MRPASSPSATGGHALGPGLHLGLAVDGPSIYSPPPVSGLHQGICLGSLNPLGYLGSMESNLQRLVHLHVVCTINMFIIAKKSLLIEIAL